MPLFYLETSALLKRYKTEQGTETINDLFADKTPDDIFVTSHFTTVEVEAAAARALRGRLLNQRAYRILLGQFSQDVGDPIVLQSMSGAVVSDAAELARRHALRGADAIHLATALRVRGAVPVNTMFMSSDVELLSAARGEGFECLDPQDPGAVERLNSLRSSG